MKTLLQQEIDRVVVKLAKQTTTSWYDAGWRDVKTEYILLGLQRAQRLVSKQNKIDKIK